MTDPQISLVNSGVSTLASTVDEAVIKTDSATSAPAISETRLEAVPPGEQPTRVRPRKRFGASPNRRDDKAAPSGIAVNCVSTPNATARGFEATRRKSAVVRVMPMPTIMRPRANVMVDGEDENQVKDVGRSMPRMAEDNTQKGKRDVIFDRAEERREGRGGPSSVVVVDAINVVDVAATTCSS